MSNFKLEAGSEFPSITLPSLSGQDHELGTPRSDLEWKMIVVYRGKHCPICSRFLGDLKAHVDALKATGIDLVAVSGDPEDKARAQMELVEPNYEVAFDLSIAQMKQLGLYISDPRGPRETDRPFAEPGIFVVNEQGTLQVTELANGPFVRPNLDLLIGGLKFIRDPKNNYPIRGMHE